jgi:hypothetical protein
VKTIAILMLATLLSGCEQTDAERARLEGYKSRPTYIQERKLARVCKDGTRIYAWRERLWTSGPNWPDDEVGVNLETVCS